MRKFALKVFSIFALLLGASPAMAETWLCLATSATGFKYSEATKKWERTNFNVHDSRYIITRPEDGRNAWIVKKFGEPDGNIPGAWCEDDFSEYGFLNCSGLMGNFSFNKNNGRYVSTYNGTYLAYNPQSEFPRFRKDGGDTPYIEIGTCSSF